jgi:hypothetical protein
VVPVRAPEPLTGWRVVARPDTLDALEQASVGSTLRLAPDDLLLVGSGAAPSVEDRDAIVVPDAGFVAWALDRAELQELAQRHVEWEVPVTGPAVAQGHGSARLVCLRAYADELAARVS